MNDKERILMAIVRNTIPCFMYPDIYKDGPAAESVLNHRENLKIGDLVFANSTIMPNDFVVGFIDGFGYDCIMIREIGSKRVTKYSNESFTRINKKYLGYEILEGTQYKTYRKVLKAFEKFYSLRFKDISFKENVCTVEVRERFESDTLFEVTFQYNSKTSVKSIAECIIPKEKEYKESRLRSLSEV